MGWGGEVFHLVRFYGVYRRKYIGLADDPDIAENSTKIAPPLSATPRIVMRSPMKCMRSAWTANKKVETSQAQKTHLSRVHEKGGI